jgi:prevent-host-death family protein
MDTAVSAADANRRFSELLRTVKKGRSVVVTSHGKPVAKITPVGEDERAAEGARSALFARLRTARALFADPGSPRRIAGPAVGKRSALR